VLKGNMLSWSPSHPENQGAKDMARKKELSAINLCAYACVTWKADMYIPDNTVEVI
jgi:hypothetical protein